MQVPQVCSTLVRNLYFTEDPIKLEEEKVKRLERELCSLGRKYKDNVERIKEMDVAKSRNENKLTESVRHLSQNIEKQKQILQEMMEKQNLYDTECFTVYERTNTGDRVCTATTLFSKRNVPLIHSFFLMTLGQG